MMILKTSVVCVIALWATTSNAGFLDWLIPTAHAPNEKHVKALDYGLTGDELSSVTGDYVTNETKQKFKEASENLPYAYLSEAVYNRDQSVKNEWKRVDDKVGEQGFHASVYKNTKSKKVVIAYQGTCAGDGVIDCAGDIKNDIQGVLVPSSQQTQAVEYATEVIKKYGSDIHVTGHSLGGGLAQTAAQTHGLKAVTFNSATVNRTARLILKYKKTEGVLITNYVMTGDPVNPASKGLGVLGKDYGKNVYLDFDIPKVLGEHSMGDVINSLEAMSNYHNDILVYDEPYRYQSPCGGVNYVCNSTLSSVITGVNQGSNSHFGASSPYSEFSDTAATTIAVVDQNNNNNAQQLTGIQQSAQATNTIAFKSSDWKLSSGKSIHYSSGNKFGSVSSPNGGQIHALNNSNVQATRMSKFVDIPVGVKQVTVSMLANFLTNEFPTYVGSIYNDKSTITIHTGSGNTYQATIFKKQLNSANFKLIKGLPSPLYTEGGQTGFESISQVIPVANGGKLTIRVSTINVGDKAFPSATLVSGTSVK